MGSKHRQVFRILRFFSIASLISILIAAILLAWLYRQVAVGGIVDYGERNNLMLTQGLLNAVRPELVKYLVHEDLHHNRPLPEMLANGIRRLMENTGVVEVDIIDDEGVVVFSTGEEGVGRNLKGTPGFTAAEQGRVHSKMGWQDGLRLFADEKAEAALINSYIPITDGYPPAVQGVFAVETDVQPLMAGIERAQLRVFFSSMVIMAALYLALLSVVHRAERIIRSQETQLR